MLVLAHQAHRPRSVLEWRGEQFDRVLGGRRERRTYEVNVFDEALLRVPAGDQLEEQHPEAVHVALLRERPAGYVLGIQVPEGPAQIGRVRDLHLFPRQPEVSDLSHTGDSQRRFFIRSGTFMAKKN